MNDSFSSSKSPDKKNFFSRAGSPSHIKHAQIDLLPQNVTKREEKLLKDQAAVRRVKKAKLNDLYFTSQVKDIIFYE